MNRYGFNEHWASLAKPYPQWSVARVCSQHQRIYHVVSEHGASLAEVSGRFRYETTALSQFPAVGDFVMLEPSQGRSIIHRVLPRRSVFERSVVGNEHQQQVIAANVDYVFVCMSLNENFSASRAERYLSVAWNSGATPVVVLTKADLCDNLSACVAEIEAVAPATDVLAVSRDNADACRRLEHYLSGGATASFIGSSGVGKSTLINRLIGGDVLATSAIREDGKGRHTTTHRELIALPQGGVVIDTPGMRELGADSVDLARSFADIDALAEQCRFGDCTHTNEPGCAVRRAIEHGELDARRLDSYRKLKREARYDGLSARELENVKLGAMFESVGGMKNVRKFIRNNDKRSRR